MTLLTDEVKALEGRTKVYTAPEPFGAAAGRYFALAIGDDNPVYSDAAYARAQGLSGVTAPLTLICETNQYATPDPITELDEMVRSAGFTLWRLGPDPEMPTLVDPSIPQTSVYCDVLALKGIHHPRLPTEPPTTSQLIAELEQELQSPHPPHRAYAALAVKNFPNAVSSDPRLVTAANEVENSEDPETQDAISRLRPILDAGTGASGSSSV